MKKPFLILIGIFVLASNSFAQVRDLDPTNTDRILLERNHETGKNIYRQCQLIAPEKRNTELNGERITYLGKEYVCPDRLGCRPGSSYSDQELIAYIQEQQLRQTGVVAMDFVAVGLIIGAGAGAAAGAGAGAAAGAGAGAGAAAATAGASLAKGLGVLTSVNVAGWTLSPYLAKITSYMDWTRFTRSMDAIALIWDLNPPEGMIESEKVVAIKEVREMMNRSLCEIDQRARNRRRR